MKPMITQQVMLDRGLIANAVGTSYRSVSYDLTVGDIYVPREDGLVKRTRRWWLRMRKTQRMGTQFKLVKEYEIPPNGVVLIFSRETVRVPHDLCGYAMPKTSLGHEGILVLNTGIVDPLYHGPLSGTTINFRDTPFTIKEGDPFLRLVFDTVDNATEAPIPPPKARAEYIGEKLVLAQNHPHTFLNLNRTAHKVSKELITDERNFLLRLLAYIGLFLTFVTLILTQWQAIPAFTKGTSDEIKKALEDSQKTGKELQGVLEDVKKERSASAAKDAERLQQVLEAQTKTIDEQRSLIDDLRRRLGAVETKINPDPKRPPQ
jgi:deoxycytidine triphosphate deaminase